MTITILNSAAPGTFEELTTEEQAMVERAQKCGMTHYASLDNAAQAYLEMSMNWWYGETDGGSKTYFECMKKTVEMREADPVQAAIDDEEFAMGFEMAHAASEMDEEC